MYYAISLIKCASHGAHGCKKKKDLLKFLKIKAILELQLLLSKERPWYNGGMWAGAKAHEAGSEGVVCMVAMITCMNYEPLGRSVFSVCTKVLNRKYYRLKTYGDKVHLCSPPPKTQWWALTRLFVDPLITKLTFLLTSWSVIFISISGNFRFLSSSPFSL